jgi:hypothetical protein
MEAVDRGADRTRPHPHGELVRQCRLAGRVDPVDRDSTRSGHESRQLPNGILAVHDGKGA